MQPSIEIAKKSKKHKEGLLNEIINASNQAALPNHSEKDFNE